MTIIVNDEQYTSDSEQLTIAELLAQKGISTKGTAVALNGKIALRKDWETRLLKEGDSLVIIKAAYGG